MLERVIIMLLVQPFLVQSVQSQNCSQFASLPYQSKENEERSSIQKAMKIEKMSRIFITYYTISYPILFSMSCIAHRVFFNDLE